MIGVLVSRGYGAGWSTWGDRNSALDKDLVAAFERKAPDEEITVIATKNWPDQYQGGLHDCEVVYLEEGTLFRINEYDGYESLETNTDIDWLVAK